MQKIDKSAYKPGMYLIGGNYPGEIVAPLRDEVAQQPTVAEPSDLAERLKAQTARTERQIAALTEAKELIKQLRFQVRWAKIERDLDWSY